MSRTNWKRIIPHSVNHALQLTKQHGIEKKGMSVERIADYLGVTADLLYKWLGTGKMPLNKIIAFEQACGINYVTQYLAQSQSFLLVTVPTGRKAENKELTDLQLCMTQVASALISFQQDKVDSAETIDAIKILMQDLAFHERNVAKIDTDQMPLEMTHA